MEVISGYMVCHISFISSDSFAYTILFTETGYSTISGFDALFISGTIVMTMIWLVMPNYTKLIKKWLYK